MSREPADEMLLAELHKILDEEVNELPEKWRVPFVLFHLENRSLAEIADAVGSSIPTVGAWLLRSRARLAERLRRRGVTVGSAGLTGILYQSLGAEAASSAFVSAAVQSAVMLSAGPTSAAACSPAIVAILKAYAAGQASIWGWASLIVIVVVLVSFSAVIWGWPILQTRSAEDFERLQGEWQEISHERDGGPVNAQPRIAYVATLKISGRRFHRYQTLTDGRVIEGGSGTFLFVQNASGNAIDFSQWQGTAHGIYDVDGDTLTMCVTTNSGTRPDNFLTAANDGRQLHKYVRVQ